MRRINTPCCFFGVAKKEWRGANASQRRALPHWTKEHQNWCLKLGYRNSEHSAFLAEDSGNRKRAKGFGSHKDGPLVFLFSQNPIDLQSICCFLLRRQKPDTANTTTDETIQDASQDSSDQSKQNWRQEGQDAGPRRQGSWQERWKEGSQQERQKQVRGRRISPCMSSMYYTSREGHKSNLWL